MAETNQIGKLKQLSARREKLMQKVRSLDNQITDLLAIMQARKSAQKQEHPKIGSGPYKLCKVMSSRPKTKEEIAKRTGLSIATVSLYLQQFACFKSAGRGKGYIYAKPKNIPK